MKGYKVFNPDWTCRGFQYEVGQSYKHKGALNICRSGFHFCRVAADCFNYYKFDSNNKVAEVEALGLVESDGDKSVTDEIKVIRELSWAEVLELVNTGKGCTGLNNSGDRNSGDWNSGWFNSTTPHVTLFNQPSDISFDELLNIKGIKILNWNYEKGWWIYSENMSEEEKDAHPEHETLGGYLKTVDYKTACAMMWERLSDEERQAVKDIPNFDPEIFKEITGIEV